ncbi:MULTISPECIES: hypothetical protein [Arthrobacter]|jgi:hypothetical protein|uniref:DUF1674 domain-containing protein n=1 Tax=Arthrobacter bambusae TaxID=1338426 RepID=A0AAW8D379_9MICC|nr:hypothetical protein [Arthrobacter bambusae]MDQ0128650.1 hypothetical protein [Arthrobacter bambusae]MDQ0179991.1 hypothetical protein [Arthrobacter bambusae]MDQ0238152.1 hypothetical protein [Arthrobacter bambusae]
MAESKSTQSKRAADTSADALGPDAELDEQEKTKVKPAPERKPAGESILPKKASEDDPRRWGDEPGYDHDAWLKEQRPPHWG